MDSIRIEITSNAAEAAKTFENLSNAFTKADNGAKDLRKEIRELKSDIFKMTPGTEEYKRALVDLGGKMDELGDIQRQLKASSGGLDAVFQSTTTALGSLAGGFQAASGIIALFGGNTENLEKTFVQLQAVMSIANGLKGFAGFIKYSKDAIASIAAFIAKITLSTAAVEADTAAKVKNTEATLANSAAQKDAAGSQALLESQTIKATAAGKGLLGIVTRIAPALIGLAAIIAAIVLPIRQVIREKEALNEIEKDYQDIISGSVKANDEATDSFKKMEAELNEYIETLREQGASEDEIRQASLEYWKERKEANIDEAEHIKSIKDEIKWYNQSIVLIKNKKTSVTGLDKEMKELTATQGNINNAIAESRAMGNPFKHYEDHLKETMKNMKLLIAEGEATAEDEYQQLIIISKKYIGEIQENARKTHRSLTTTERDNIKAAQENIKDYEYQIKLLQAGARKTMRDETKKTVTEYKKNFDSISEAISTALSGIKGDFESEFNRIAGTDVEGKTVISNLFIKFRELTKAGVDKDLIENFKKDINEAKLTDSQKKELLEQVEGLKKEYENILNSVIQSVNPELHIDENTSFDTDKMYKIMTQANDVIDIEIENVTDFRKRIELLKTAFEKGEIDPGQYAEAIHRNIRDYYNTLSQGMHDIPKYINEIMQSDVFEGMTVEDKATWRKILEKYFEQALHIPDSELATLSKNANNEVLSQLDAVFNEIERQMDAANIEAERRFYAQSNDIMYNGQGLFGKLIGGVFWGTGEGQSYKLAKQQTEESFNAFKAATDSEIANIDRLMAAAGEDVALREELNQRKLDLQAKYNLSIEQYYNDLENLEHEHLTGIMSNIGAVTGATSSLGDALSGYYEEMANDERLSEDQQKEYTLKSLRMKKAMAVVNIAQGIVAAIAGAMELGFPMGPIVAALESAAVAASGATQIAAINRQMRELGGSAGSDSTPNAAGMVDRIVTANAQNTDQRDQLNAQYGQAGDQRVYVTQTDLDAGRKSRSVAVTQNGF